MASCVSRRFDLLESGARVAALRASDLTRTLHVNYLPCVT